MVDMDMVIKLIISIVEMNAIIGLMINMVAVDHSQIIKDMGSIDTSVAIKGTIFMLMTTTNIVNTCGKIIRTTLVNNSQSETNSLEGGCMKVYNAGVIHCDYIT